jgi:hypothetical protein
LHHVVIESNFKEIGHFKNDSVIQADGGECADTPLSGTGIPEFPGFEIFGQKRRRLISTAFFSIAKKFFWCPGEGFSTGGAKFDYAFVV